MGKKAEELMPLTRTERLIVEELPGEVLVLDLDDNQAHCLNPTSALVWRLCDGKTTVSEAARRLSREFDAPTNEEVVWLALRQLGERRLLEEAALPSHRRAVTRRELILKYAPAALALPAVMSVATPTAADLVSTCLGVTCVSGSCCSGFTCEIPEGAVRGVCIPAAG